MPYRNRHQIDTKTVSRWWCDDEVRTFLTEGKYRFTPEYWWPTDCSWCLCSDYDLMFTVVGGLAGGRLLEPRSIRGDVKKNTFPGTGKGVVIQPAFDSGAVIPLSRKFIVA